MPTSGEARIRPTSSYNLRSRPLPKTRSLTSAGSSLSKNKENLLHPASKLKKSQIPVPARSTPSSKAKSGTSVKSKNTPSERPKSRTRTVPDFAKLHKSWQQSFNKGKACNKKKCTEVRAFDLTKPGAVFQPKYFDGTTTSSATEVDEVFETDEGALHSILNEGVSATSHRSGRSTMTGFGGSVVTQPKPSRQTLGSLPRTFQGRANNPQNTRDPVQFERHDAKGEQRREPNNPLEQEQRRRKESLAEQQQDMDIDFESDEGALASILNNTGADFRHRKTPLTRQTIGTTMGVGRTPQGVFSGRPSQGPLRTSIYYQRPRNMNYNRVFTDYKNLLLSRLSLAAPPVSSKPLTFDQPTILQEKTLPQSGSKVTGQASEVVGQSNLTKSAARRVRTPATASRVRNQRFQAAIGAQDTTSSPALRAPPSSLRKATSTHKEGKAYSVKWADVLSPPAERLAANPSKDELATTLFTDEDTQILQPDTLKPTVIEQESLQAACLAKQNEIQHLEKQAAIHRTELEEMNEIERQLELEIEKLQLDGSLLSPSSGSPGDRTDVDNQLDKKQILSSPDASYLHTQQNFLDVQTLRQDHFSRPDFNSLQVPSAIKEGVSEVATSPIEVAAQSRSAGGGAPYQGSQHFVPSFPVNEIIANSATDATARTLVAGRPFKVVDVPEKPFGGLSLVPEAEAKGKMEGANYQAALSQGSTVLSRDFRPEIQGQDCIGSQNQDVFRTSGQQRSGNQPHIPSRNYDHGTSSNHYVQMPNKKTDLLWSDSGQFVKAFLNQPIASNQFVNQGFPSHTSSTSNHGNTFPSSISSLSNSLQTPLRDSQLSRVGMALESFKEPFNPGSKEQAEDFMGDRPSTWMSSTPAQIQTPHAVKPHSMIKQLALKQSLPSSSLPGSQRVSQHKPPIHTPLAMRTMSMWDNQKPGTSPVQFVSPVGVRSGQICQREADQERTAEMHHPIPAQPQRDIPNGYPTSATAATSNPGNSVTHLQPAEWVKPTSSLKSTGQGSLSLGAELLTSGGAAAFLKSKMKPLLSAKTDQLFQEALLDEECALYACRLPSKFSPRIAEDRLCFDPVAKILMDGDDMHFVPIQSNGNVYISSPIGSAFNMYSTISS
ncbi:uncharacterized protein [Asterias amurensis]|uniref:uncharacterized protein n=1 Tax=Asterias amurensis TaxID=7602 RepID=UPI003AB7473F